MMITQTQGRKIMARKTNAKTRNDWTKSISLPVLRKAYENIVRAQLGEASFLFNVDVEWIEDLQFDSGVMCHVVVTPNDGMLLIDMLPALEGLQIFTQHEGMILDHAGRYWLLGDGDDSLAVSFEKGSFRIWLRGWKEHPYADGSRTITISD
jgi:hypothetical protein